MKASLKQVLEKGLNSLKNLWDNKSGKTLQKTPSQETIIPRVSLPLSQIKNFFLPENMYQKCFKI